MRYGLVVKRRTRLAQVTTLAERRAVRRVKPDPQLWREAMRIARGDPRRIEVVNPRMVVVKNRRVR